MKLKSKILGKVVFASFCFLSIPAPAASVSDCTLASMRPYIMSGLREYAASTLYVQKIETYPKDVKVVYLDTTGAEDAFEIQLVTHAGLQVRVYSSDSTGAKQLLIPSPKIETNIGDDGRVLGQKCVAYTAVETPRYSVFENENTGDIIYQDLISSSHPMLAWVAISQE